ncbi:hypothetical protein ACXZ66_07140 [Corynebacterium sp. S7]
MSDDRNRGQDRRSNRGEDRPDRRNPRSNDRRSNDRNSSGKRSDSRSSERRREDGKIRHDRSNPHRHGFREDRMAQKLSEPDLPGEVDIRDLDPMVLQDLRPLSKDNADRVAKHMIMAASLMADDPQLALRHARAAKNRAGRVGVVREVNGIAAYHAGEWKEALAELRAARRMSGGPGLLAVMADCERGLGRPEKAIELSKSPDARELDAESKIELAIVAAGARRDLGQNEAAVATLQKMNPSMDSTGISQVRLSYAYADALLAAGRKDEAKQWFEHVVEIDTDESTDAALRVEELG